jgi:DNA-binding transcriptional MerR regulator
MYEADPGFIRKLKELDKRLDCVYNRDAERFVIMYNRGYGEPLAMFMVKAGEGKGGFRYPDERDLERLQKADLSKTSLKDYLDEIARYMEDYRKMRRKKTKEEWRDRTKDDRLQLMKAMAQVEAPGTGGGWFPRITPKPKKGFTVIDKRKLNQMNPEGEKNDSSIQPN